MVYAVIITQYQTSAPKIAVRVEFHLVGKFETDTCPRPLIIPHGMITSFSTYAVTLAMSYGAEGRAESVPKLPEIFFLLALSSIVVKP